MIKVLNLYSGIGGNRKLWENVEVTAVEIEPLIAKIYQDFFPSDKIIIGDAHKYLLDHYEEFDFIWSSPPCPTHSSFAMLRVLSDDFGRGNYCYKPKYPDMKLYEEILFLQYLFKGKYCVENVKSYYEPLIKPQKIQRHYFWANFWINKIKLPSDKISDGTRDFWEKKLGLSIKGKYMSKRKDTILRNCVEPKLGLHIFDCAFRKTNIINYNKQLTLLND